MRKVMLTVGLAALCAGGVWGASRGVVAELFTATW